MTACWNKVYSRWEMNPTEATEDDPAEIPATHWIRLPENPA